MWQIGLILAFDFVFGLVARAGADGGIRRLEEMKAAVREAVAVGDIPGAVVCVEVAGRSETWVEGWQSVKPEVVRATTGTVYDMASMTKVMATTPSMMQLVEAGKVDLEAPVAKYLPEFQGGGKEAVTVKRLMTHNSGLPPGIAWDAAHPWSGYEEGIRRACAEPLRYAPGTDFVYSDINFILLGELVRRVSGQRLDVYAREHVFTPLGMGDTTFCPAQEWPGRIAPTTVGKGAPKVGEVHDPTSRRMGGVCGHAGLFSTAADVARYARALLNGGALDGARILKPRTVAQMTHVQSPAGVAALRGLGWDVDSRYASQRGSVFTPGAGFGHTGWTGPSLWVDPPSQSFVAFLSNRNHPTEAGETKGLRGRLGTLAGLGIVEDWADTAGLLPVAGKKRVRSGLEVAAADGFAFLREKRVGVITNQTGVDNEGRSVIDLLAGAPGIKLAAIFSPEHGLRGKLDQEKIADGKDEKTGVPVFSLYGESRKPTAEQLKAVDFLVFDIQDIGCRFYTYISTLKQCLEAAAAAGKEFVVLDRVNPINGVTVEGPLRDGEESFTACHRIPLRHGMTAGELAQMLRAELKLAVPLTVIPCEGWRRWEWFDETGLTWVNPSPNMRSLAAAVVYPGTALLEFTNVSVGRGTATPFELVGAPWMDGAAVAKALNAEKLAGVTFEAATFTPTAAPLLGKECHGVRVIVKDRAAFEAVTTGVALMRTLVKTHPKEFETKNLNKLLAHPSTQAGVLAGKDVARLRAGWEKDVREFVLRRQPFLIYR